MQFKYKGYLCIKNINRNEGITTLKYTNNKMKNFRLGDLLVLKGVIDEEQLEKALTHQKTSKTNIGSALIALGFVTDEDIAFALEEQLGIEKIELRNTEIDPDAINSINGSLLRKHCMVPVGYSDANRANIILAMSNPADVVAQDDVSIITGCMVIPKISTISEINSILDKYFGNDEAMSAAEKYSNEQRVKHQEEKDEEVDDGVSDKPIVQLVRTIIEQAARQRASDVHIDALEKQVRVRYRIDGALTEKMLYDLKLLPAISSRIKILGGMDISEKRKPQDGRMTTIVDKTEYDIRISVLPSSYGEKIVMRLASNKAFNMSKTDLGMTDRELVLFDKIIKNPNGIILVTGPTGSGKSTTLYTSLSELNDESVNIITVEDPVEANIAGVNQVQVNTKAELTFASALRSILRQDPDIIMIGEIRDIETAGIAVQASITGHLVVSTLHTNSSAATITRLLDMGVQSFMLADSIVGIIAQRLVRRLCPECKKGHLATEEDLASLKMTAKSPPMIYDAVGCDRCGGTGYRGRIGVYEIMDMTPDIKTLVAAKATTKEIKEKAVAEGMSTLFASARTHVLNGNTSVKEMLKVSAES